MVRDRLNGSGTLQMLELMQHPDCSDLWEDTASDQEEEVADGTRFGEMVREWHEVLRIFSTYNLRQLRVPGQYGSRFCLLEKL